MVNAKRRKQEILESEEKYRILFENLYDAALVVDVETGRVVECNRQATELLGRTRDEIMDMPFIQIHPPDQAETYQWRFARHVAMGREADYDGEIFRKDGTRVPVNISGCAIDVGGRRISLGLFHDITERKRAEQALKESENRYRDLFNHASNAVLITNLDERVIEVNQAASNIYGYTIKEMTRMKLSEILSRETYNTVQEVHKKLLKNENFKRNSELEIVRKDGLKVPVESVSRLLVKNGEPVGFHDLFRDITQLKQFKENMHFYIARIIEAQEEERRRIARDIHDETAQSLATLSLNIEAIAKADDKIPEETLKRLEELRVKTSVILEGVRRLCSELRPDVLDYLGLLPALGWLTTELKREKQISGHVKIIGKGRRLPDETELALFRIAQEALSNVKKHSEATEVEVVVRFTADKVKLSVSDNGKGVEFPKVPGDFARKGKLGLIGIQERVNLLNGKFSIVSHQEKERR